jgi:hypothetical protein
LAYLQCLQGAATPPDAAAGDDAEEDESLTEAALRQARVVFEGGFAVEGERQRSAYVQRSFESFDDLATDLPHWATTLYGGLLDQVQMGGALRREALSQGATP